jgi:hypothetical protein
MTTAFISQLLVHAHGQSPTRQRAPLDSLEADHLGIEGHWLLDGIDAEGYQVVVHTVPAVPRFILLHGFARAYRRRAQARWQPNIQAGKAERVAAR